MQGFSYYTIQRQESLFTEDKFKYTHKLSQNQKDSLM